MPTVVSNIIDFYAREDELFLKHLVPFTKSSLQQHVTPKAVQIL